MLLKSECDAEDVAQEVFCKLWMQPEVWRDVQKPDGYIFMMTKNLILNIFKHQRIEQEYQENVIDQKLLCEIVESEQLDDIYYKEMQMIVRLVLERMPERRRAIFELSRFEGLSNKEIAAKFNISVRTVEHQIYQALIELKKILLFFVFYGFLYK
jgi:RNA polymerase sigma factor, sigma-70 family/RNA polymerase sigma-70 factor, Bacteroides expansion family 1